MSIWGSYGIQYSKTTFSYNLTAVGLCLHYYEGAVFVVLELVLFTNMKCKHTKHYSVKLRFGYVDGIDRNELLPVLHSTDQFWLADPTPKVLIWCIGKVTKFTVAPLMWILHILPHILMIPHSHFTDPAGVQSCHNWFSHNSQ